MSETTLAPAGAAAPATPAPLPSLQDRAGLIDTLRQATTSEPAPADDAPASEPAAEPEAPVAPDAQPEGPSAEEPTPEEPQPEPAAEPAAEFKVPVPLPNGDGENGPTNAGTLEITLPTQEAADTLRFHVKQSARAARLEERLTQARNDVATVDFLEQHPTEGLHWLAESNPEAAQTFFTSMLKANPLEAAKAMQELGFTVDLDPAAQRALEAESRLERVEAKRRVEQGQHQFKASAALEHFKAAALDVVDDLAVTLNLARDGEDYEVFSTRASTKLTKLWQTQQGRVTKADIAATLEPLVRAMAPSPKQVQARAQERRPDGTFAPAEPAKPAAPPSLNKDKLRQLAGPAGSAQSPLVAAITKLPPTTTLYDVRDLANGKRTG